eukprot:CAMPEP_0172332366 /NCGR_PEP_ID=MMETSP1058-20130122/62399_1 /TAXON_ID=83371 /ORGANISM="Detonula confervacea, Strain CCMP 353" /LENGTH=266 /DNA_ID=CAMNT_0013049647 /DNA_START=15 /DNA_END=815 /DNA_ORIENTATION=-
MSTATQRKAWNEAMRSAGAVLPASATASGTVSSSRGGVASRASDRRRKRRDKARKSSAYGDGGGAGGGSSSLEEKDFRVAIHMDMLEGVTDNAVALDGDDDDEYDEFADLEDDGGGKSKGKAKSKRKRKSAVGGGAGKKTSSVPKYLKARSLASILIEEASRSDSVAKQYVGASARRLGSGNTSSRKVDSNIDAITTTFTNPYPCRKFCPVTGLFGEYTEPKSGIPYASLSALEQIRERSPPWMTLGSAAGTASYWEAVKSLQNNG